MKKILLLCAVALLPLVGCEKQPVQTPEDPSTENPGGENPGKEEPTPEVITDWFVTVDGAGEKTGKNWENAMGVAELNAFLAQPVDAEGNQIDAEAHEKAALLDGTTIHLAAGEYNLAGETYAPVKIEFTNYTKPVALTILGGYPAGLTEKATTGRDAATNVTEFTGDNLCGIVELGNQTDVTFDGITFKNAAFTENGGAIDASAGETGECTLTVTNCKFTGNRNAEGKTGASMYLVNAAANIKNCYFANNYARNGSAINMGSGKGAVVVEDCIFEQNETFNTSGAIQNGGKVAEVKNCTFKKNKAGSWGGGAFHTGGEGANTTFTNCVFEENTAPYGGAISVEAATVTFNSCSFTKNTATQAPTEDSATPNAGGAIILRNDAAVCTLNDCTFTENQAVTGCGGAIVATKNGAKLTINGGSFTNNTSFYHAGAIMTFGELYVAGSSSAKVNFIGNNTLTTAKAEGNGGAMWIGDNTKVDLKYVYFKDNEAGKEEGTTVNYSNGGAIYVKGADLFNVDNCEFTGGRARNGGGIAMNLGISVDGVVTQKTGKITNCNFHDIICRSGADHQNTGDGAGNFNGGACQIGYGNVEFENCVFQGNVVQNSSAALHINDVCSVSCTDCQFINNKAYANHGCIKMEKAGEKLYLNRCLFEGNEGDTRGMINPGANTMVYLNRVVFANNKTIKAGKQYGVVMHCAGANVCMNNVTSYNNYNANLETGAYQISFNSDGGWLVVNSTIIDKTPYLFRANGTPKVALCNNIMINTMNPDKIFILSSSDIYKDYGHNLMSCSGDHDKAVLAATDVKSVTAETLAGTYGNGVYSWTNSLTGFTPATSADVYAAISEYTEGNATVGVENFGADFYNWLKTIGEVTESGDQKIFKDGRGETRTGNYQPGAYQAK